MLASLRSRQQIRSIPFVRHFAEQIIKRFRQASAECSIFAFLTPKAAQPQLAQSLPLGGTRVD